MVSLYTIGLPDADAGQPNNRIGSQIQQTGLVEQGGVATEQIATSNVDLTLTGQWRYGERFARKAARELESLGRGSYSALPLFDASSTELARQTGYYEIGDVDVSPAHPTSEDVFEFTVGLNETGTRETHWRAVRTTQETVDTLFTGGDTSYVAIPNEATKAQWYDSQQGTEKATATDTVASEFGSVDRFDPADSAYDNPILLYELPFEREGRIDTKVWDDRDREKFWTFTDSSGTSVEFNQWAHVFHTAWEFDGSPVIDTGRLRLYFNIPQSVDDLLVEDGETLTIESGEVYAYRDGETETGGTIDIQTGGTLLSLGESGTIFAERWDETNDEWASLTVRDTTWEILDVDITAVGPHEVQAQFLWTDGSDIVAVNGIFDRGDDSVLWVKPDNESPIPQGIKDIIEPIARKTSTNVAPSQTVIARSETRR